MGTRKDKAAGSCRMRVLHVQALASGSTGNGCAADARRETLPLHQACVRAYCALSSAGPLQQNASRAHKGQHCNGRSLPVCLREIGALSRPTPTECEQSRQRLALQWMQPTCLSLENCLLGSQA
eukprot:1158199-Pelagomonas_calceolata.AAC.11